MCISQKIVWKVELLLECTIVFLRVETDTKNDRIFRLEVLDSITEPIALDGSARRISFRIPPEQNEFACIRRQGNRCPILVGKLKRRGIASYINH